MNNNKVLHMLTRFVILSITVLMFISICYTIFFMKDQSAQASHEPYFETIIPKMACNIIQVPVSDSRNAKWYEFTYKNKRILFGQFHPYQSVAVVIGEDVCE